MVAAREKNDLFDPFLHFLTLPCRYGSPGDVEETYNLFAAYYMKTFNSEFTQDGRERGRGRKESLLIAWGEREGRGSTRQKQRVEERKMCVHVCCMFG